MEHEQPQQLPEEPTAAEQPKKFVIDENGNDGVEREMTRDEVRAALKKTVEVKMVRVNPQTGEKTDA